MGRPVTLSDLLRRVVEEQFGGEYRGFARAIEMDPAHAARLVKGMATNVSAETAIRMADAYDLNPDDVLAASGKVETAQRLRRLYGKAAPVRGQRTAQQREWEAALDALDPGTRRDLLSIASKLAQRT